MTNSYAMLGCPACQTYILNGKQKYMCRARNLACTQLPKCPLKTQVVEVLEYARKAANLEDIKEGIKEITRYLKEKR